VRYIERRRPRAAVLENVSRLTSRGRTWHTQVIARLQLAGYTVHQQVLSPEQYGCAQSRPRLYLVALLHSTFSFPTPIPLTTTCMEALVPSRVGEPPIPPSTLKLVVPWGTRRGLWCPSHFELQRRGLNPPSQPRIRTDVAPCLVSKQPSMVVQHERRCLK
jgi:site-specific DNA-cytosine methylase